MTKPILNIAAYRFAELTDRPTLRAELLDLCARLKLLGTILLSPEGINLFIAGRPSAVGLLMDRIRKIPGLAEIEVKESFTDTIPFRRLRVRLKREIISFGVPGIDPAKSTARKLARNLKQWLDEGRPVVLLDTRNGYELQAGTFRNAIDPGIDDFRHFPEAVARLPADLKDLPVVTFCTGGIRCEKAAPYLEREGFREVYQLQGGILKYFEECGTAHFKGSCYVFDQRVALDGNLNPSGEAQCRVCEAILSADDQAMPSFVPDVSCPRCVGE